MIRRSLCFMKHLWGNRVTTHTVPRCKIQRNIWPDQMLHRVHLVLRKPWTRAFWERQAERQTDRQTGVCSDCVCEQPLWLCPAHKEPPFPLRNCVLQLRGNFHCHFPLVCGSPSHTFSLPRILHSHLSVALSQGLVWLSGVSLRNCCGSFTRLRALEMGLCMIMCLRQTAG